MNHYELLLILKTENDLEAAKKILKSSGVKVVKEDIWGLRKLAYPIKRVDSGFYAILDVEIGGAKVKDLAKKLELEEGVLRALVFSRDSS